MIISEEILNPFRSSDLVPKVYVIRMLGTSVTEFDKCRCATQPYDTTVLFEHQYLIANLKHTFASVRVVLVSVI